MMDKVTSWIILTIIMALISKSVLSLAAVIKANLEGQYLLNYIADKQYNGDYLVYYCSNALYIDFTLIALTLNLYKWLSKIMDIE